MNFRLSPSDKKLEETRFKTNICRNIMEKGFCSYGDKCQFAHGTDVSFINTFPVVNISFRRCAGWSRTANTRPSDARGTGLTGAARMAQDASSSTMRSRPGPSSGATVAPLAVRSAPG